MTSRAIEKLRDGEKVQMSHRSEAMKSAVRAALEEFCRQDGEFAQAVVQGGTFADCMKEVEKGIKGNAISDLEAYRRAVAFYFPGAGIEMQMRINLCESVQTHETKTVQLDLLSLL